MRTHPTQQTRRNDILNSSYREQATRAPEVCQPRVWCDDGVIYVASWANIGQKLKFRFSAPNLFKNVLLDLKWHRRKFLAKRPSGYWENHFLWGAHPRFEKTGSHTLPHTHALLAKRTWTRLTLLRCPVRKGPPQPNFTCLQGNKVFLHSLTDKALLESHSKGETQNPIECTNSLIRQVCLKETFCGAKNCGDFSSSGSMNRRVLGRCMTWCNFSSVARLSTSSRPWIKGASVTFITPNVRSGAEEKTFQRGEWWGWFRGWG